MTSRRDAAASGAALSKTRLYVDIERFRGEASDVCAGCAGVPHFALIDATGDRFLQCEDCLVETFRDDPAMTARVLRAVAERI